MPARLAPALLLLAAVAALGLAAAGGGTARFDRALSLDLQAGVPGRLHEVLVAVSIPVDEWYGILSAALVVGVVLWRLGPRPAGFVLLVGTSTILVSTGIKWLYGRARPADPIAVLVPQPGSASYPSGHVVWVAAFVGAAIYVFCRDGSRRARWTGIAVVGLALVVMSLSRVYLGQHFATDVLGGALLGLGCLTAALALRPEAGPTGPRPPA